MAAGALLLPACSGELTRSASAPVGPDAASAAPRLEVEPRQVGARIQSAVDAERVQSRVPAALRSTLPAAGIDSPKPGDAIDPAPQPGDVTPDRPYLLEARNGERVVEFRPEDLIFRGADGSITGRLKAWDVAVERNDTRQELEEIYGPGTRVRVERRDDGAYIRTLILDGALELPAGTESIELWESMRFDADLSAHTDEASIAAGQRGETLNALSLRNTEGAEVFHIPTPTAWDAAAGTLDMRVPWMGQVLHHDEAGHARLMTRLPAAWLAEETRRFPVHIDPSVHPQAPPPIIASANLTHKYPTAMTGTAAYTFTNWYLDEMATTIFWGDGQTDEIVRRGGIHQLHDYDDPGIYRIEVQVCDFAVPPRCVRTHRMVPIGHIDCDGLDTACGDWEYNLYRGCCDLVNGVAGPCGGGGGGCTDASDCGAGEICNAGGACIEDCDAQGANPCASGQICDAVLSECVRKPNCAEDGAGCDHTCTDTATGFECGCHPGFRLDPGGEICLDIDECAENSHDCGTNEVCDNDVPFFNCFCESGFQEVNDVCVEVDECAAGGAAECVAGATCVDQVDAFVCECPSGQVGDGLIVGSGCSSPVVDLAEAGPHFDIVGTHTQMYLGARPWEHAGSAFSSTGETHEWGGPVLALADLNGDGRDDLAIGAPMFDGADRTLDDPCSSDNRNQSGAVFVFLGRDTVPLVGNAIDVTNADVTIVGNCGGDHFGSAVAFADPNGDGQLDLVVGAQDADYFPAQGSNRFAAGLVYVFDHADILPSGGPVALDLENDAPNWLFVGDDTSADFGAGLAIGDFNNDGFDDIATGARDQDSCPGRSFCSNSGGQVYIIAGQPAGGLLFDMRNDPGDALAIIDGSSSVDELGSWFAVGDTNNDGIDDLLVGAAEARRDAGVFFGAAFLFLGGPGLSGSMAAFNPIDTEPDPDDILGFGRSTVSFWNGSSNRGHESGAIADVNGDGFDDVIIGWPEDNGLGDVRVGVTRVYYGRDWANDTVFDDDGANAATLPADLRIDALGSIFANFGTSLSTGDWDDDGQTDLLLGSGDYWVPDTDFPGDRRERSGAAFLYTGASGALSGAAGAAISEAQAVGSVLGADIQDGAGRSTAMGDFNGDGCDDLFVGAPRANVNGVVSSDRGGRVYVVPAPCN